MLVLRLPNNRLQPIQIPFTWTWREKEMKVTTNKIVLEKDHDGKITVRVYASKRTDIKYVSKDGFERFDSIQQEESECYPLKDYEHTKSYFDSLADQIDSVGEILEWWINESIGLDLLLICPILAYWFDLCMICYTMTFKDVSEDESNDSRNHLWRHTRRNKRNDAHTARREQAQAIHRYGEVSIYRGNEAKAENERIRFDGLFAGRILYNKQLNNT
jgi:hypothetical protein